jgi:hypothetical protein
LRLLIRDSSPLARDATAPRGACSSAGSSGRPSRQFCKRDTDPIFGGLGELTSSRGSPRRRRMLPMAEPGRAEGVAQDAGSGSHPLRKLAQDCVKRVRLDVSYALSSTVSTVFACSSAASNSCSVARSCAAPGGRRPSRPWRMPRRGRRARPPQKTLPGAAGSVALSRSVGEKEAYGL